jgi:hypothetical protein
VRRGAVKVARTIVTRREPSAQDRYSAFIDGHLIDVCGDEACHAAGWTGP